MLWNPDKRTTLQYEAATTAPRRKWGLRITSCALPMVFALTLGMTQPSQQLPTPAGLVGQGSSINKTAPDAASAARRDQLAEDSARLLDLACALKAEVDKTNKDMLSMDVIRRASEIEKLARSVRQQMKPEPGVR